LALHNIALPQCRRRCVLLLLLRFCCSWDCCGSDVLQLLQMCVATWCNTCRVTAAQQLLQTCKHACPECWGPRPSTDDPVSTCEASHLCNAALHDEEVWVVHVQLHRLEQVSNTPARQGRSSTDTSMCVSTLCSDRKSAPNQVVQRKKHMFVCLL
jgi:hypothetical protein